MAKEVKSGLVEEKVVAEKAPVVKEAPVVVEEVKVDAGTQGNPTRAFRG